MMVIEMREAAQERALELIDEAKDLGRQKKMALCELEDTLYDCFEEPAPESAEPSEEGTDLGFKSKYNRHYAMRNFDDEYDRDMDMRHMYRRRAMRMRRNRAGRYA
jgi:2-polyprenyl-6-methoxyphenol hydroxylase-like FAD-dependent oxidoreductase